MPDDTERLVVLLEARLRDFEKNMQKGAATGTRTYQQLTDGSARATRQMEADMARATARINQAMATTSSRVGTFGKAFAAIGAIAGVKSFQELADSATNITNALKVAGLSGDGLKTTLGQLYEVALRNHAPIESLAQLYSRVSISQKELGISSEQLIGFTDNVGKALRISGTSATEAAGPMLQLAQALGSGTVHAEEFNSIVEGMPALAQAAAKGIKQANGSVAELKNLVNNQQLSSRALFDGIIAGSSDLDTKLKGSSTTIGQAFTDLKTSLTRLVGDFDTATGAAEKTANLLEGIAGGLANIKFDNAIAGINGIIQYLDTAIGKAGTLWQTLEGALTAMNNGNPLTDLAPPGNTEKEIYGLYMQSLSAGKEQIANSEKLLDLEQQRAKIIAQYGKDNPVGRNMLKSVEGQISAMQDATTKGKDDLPQTVEAKRFATPHGHATPTMPAPEIEQIDITDKKYATTKKSKDGSGKADKLDSYDREAGKIRERTAALQAETAAQAAINPLVNDYGYAVEKAGAAQDLLSAAQKAGTAAGKELKSVQQLLSGDFANLSPAARQQAQDMLTLADGYANARVGASKLHEEQENLRDAVNEWRDVSKDATKGFIDDLRQGKSAAEAFSGVLDKLISKLEDSLLDGIFGTSKSGGIFDSLFSSILGGGLSSSLVPDISTVPIPTPRPGFAKGTDFAPGGTAWVGEEGPELVNLPRGSQVIPNDRLSSLSVGSAVNVHVTSDVRVSVDNDGNLQGFVENTATRITRQGVQELNDQLPDRVAQINLHPRQR
ncbi:MULTISPECIES: tape measure protein [unclassified Rhizobium]|uniref:tape measure protein n=1 Tax=unclassified Rhizobium TaxID=2613769 RepID=UPI00160D6EB1|nr:MULTISPECIES: tape measure protein [unclassified Rhizobium]MBB3289911.1 tape measure domain-containing protein [Rhizobium sp. BK252]MBB3404140.1 tape measure domain-containing protein [Rhizobium sp. BK289]MBB3417239.1 tape measure domain-containing protein [Rhizobium sp. BK284]MBB3485116.1 tape measure domain-containing protein [Rhizobium sp. BK347]